jgi:hypothetical protein
MSKHQTSTYVYLHLADVTRVVDNLGRLVTNAGYRDSTTHVNEDGYRESTQ